MSDQERAASKAALAVALDSLVRSFQEQFDSNESPTIEDFLRVAPTEAREELFARLFEVEVARRSSAGATISAEEWKRRFPKYRAAIDRAIGVERSSPGSERTVGDDTAKSTAAALEGTIDLSSRDVADAGATRSLDSSGKTSPRRGSHPKQGTAESFGDYELLGEIARGGMGVVYKARQAKLNRIVAIKMILAGQLASEEDVRRFYSEAEAAARLDHPGIVPIYEVGEIDGCHFFSMGFVDGASLHDEAASGPLPQRRAAELVRQIAEAVEYAHLHGIVHRDLKPRNILLASDDRPRVTDFGLAKRADSGVELTVSGQVLGTPAYMPPEQAGGHLSQVGPRSDVYSLGGVLYFLLTGRPPFQAATLAETLTQVLESPPVGPRLLNPSVDRDLETICLKCLEKNPAHRYASAQDLAEELGRYLAGEPIRARRLGPVSRTIRWVRRRPLAAALIGSLATLLIVVAVAGSAGAEVVGRLRTSELERQLEERIAAAEPTPEFLSDTDRLLAELRPRSVDAAETFRQRTDQAFAEAVRRNLRRPNLDAEAIAGAESSIELLRNRDAELADALAGELDRRRRDWAPIFRLAPPFANADEFFPQAVRTTVAKSEHEGDILRANVAGDKTFLRALTNVSSDGAVRLRATFDRSWRDAKVVGLLLEADAATGYQFTVEGLPVAPGDGETSEDFQAMSLSQRLERDGALVAVIRRNGDPLVRRTVDDRELADGPLTLTATFERGTIRLQANSLPPLSFVDPFPIRTRGAFGLIWPANVGLMELQASRQPIPEANSPLEQGDDAFERGEFAAALEQYQLQELQSDDVAIGQECRFKQAMSLFELGRYEEASAKFQEVLHEEGDRWPPLAGARLWALQLRQHRREEADGTFDLLSSKYDFSRFAPLIPTQVRDEISAAYQTNLYQVSEAIRFDPERLLEVQRAAAVDRYFSEDGRGDPMVQIDVARACGLLGDLDGAVKAAEPVARDTRHSTVLRHYVRFLRLAGNPEGARWQLEEFLRRNPEVEKKDLLLAIERARIYAALEDWDRCEAEVDELYRRVRTGEAISPVLMTYAALIKGELLERRGAHVPAKAIRRKAYEAARPVVASQASSMTDVLHVMILGSLCDEIDEASVRQLFAILLRDGGDNAMLRQAQAMIDPSALAKSLREMWRSPLGRRYAEAFAFETIPLRDRVKVPACLAAVEYVDQTSMRGEMSPEQEEVAFETIGAAMDGMVYDGSIQMGQVVQLALTWKGQSGFIGWGAVGPTLDPKVRAGFAYTFAHRYVAMGNKDQAIKFLETAEKDAPDGSLLKRLAPRDREALEREEGFLAIRSEAAGPVKLAVTVAGGSEPREILAEDGVEIPVPAGDVTIALIDAPPGIELSRTQARVELAGRTAVALRATWAPAPEGTSLRGLVPRPSAAAVGSRWQVVFRDAAQRPVDVSWSGDGTRFAVASEDGYVRIYPADGTEPAAMLVAPSGLRHLCWGPSVDRILGAGENLPLCGWDATTGVRIFLDASRHGYSSISWRADAEEFVSSTTYGGKHLRVWDADGGLLLAPSHVQEGSEFVALSPDSDCAVIRVWRGGYADLHLHDLHAASSPGGDGSTPPSAATPKILTGPGESVYQSGAFSPDGRLFVAGSRTSELSVWKVEDWSRQRLAVEDHWVEHFGWSADSSKMFVLPGNAPAMIFDATTDPPTLAARVPTPRLSRGDVSPDSRTIAYADYEARLHRVRIEDGQAETFGASVRSHYAVAATSGPDRRIAVAGAESLLRLFDDEGRQVATVPTTGDRAVVALAWSPDGGTLAGISEDRRVHFWSSAGELLNRFDVQARIGPPTLEWSEEGGAVNVVAENGDLLEVDPQSGPIENGAPGEAPPEAERIYTFTQSTRGARAIVKHDGTVSVADSADAEAKPVDLADGAKGRRVAWSPDGTILCVVDDRERIGFLSPSATSPVLAPYQGAAVRSIAWSPDGAHLAATLSDGRVQVWLAEGVTLTAELASPSDAEIRELVWLDENRLAAVGLDGALRLARFDENGLAWGASTLALPDGGWARFSPGGELLDSEGDLEESVRYVVETPSSTLELLRPSEFRQRVAMTTGRASGREAGGAASMPLPPTVPGPEAGELDLSPAEVKDLASVEDERISESSGLALCSSRPDALWTHNDSGDPDLFLVDFDGATLGRARLGDARCVDWEDLASVRLDGKNFLLIADTGDNLRQREQAELYLVEEPDANGLAEEAELSVAKERKLTFEHGPRDCEAIAFDSERGVVLFLTKEIERECELYEATLDLASEEPLTARRIASLELPSVTGMDVTRDGTRLAALTMSHVWEYDRERGESWSDALKGRPRVYALPSDRQYEAIAYGADGRTMLLTSEGSGQPLVALSPSER